ncbi:MAG: carboxypeptidase-like regulatory domain-containing protein, partial [Prevotellaceae bacterium]|nr:carboxypeptidase-like regulatory domain-containing protein [Prevotellaceae bacterium]
MEKLKMSAYSHRANRWVHRMQQAARAIVVVFACVAMCLSAAYAQSQLSVSGTVRDGNGEPVVGASVTVKGSTIGVTTDVSGGYTITAPADATLVFSFLGLSAREEAVSGRGRIDVALGEDARTIDEVVVVAYGTVKKKDLTGAVSTVDTKAITAQSNSSVSRALEGAVAGVQVSAM